MSAYFENSSSASGETTPAEASVDTETAATADVADPQMGSCAPGTLHDFVSSLINDQAAKAAYLADPMGTLSAAGLGDLSPADVQDALPLVADSLPTDLTALPVVGDLPLDLPTALPTGLPALGDLTGSLTSGGLPSLGDLPVVGDLPVSLPTGGLDGLTGALPVDGLSGLTGALPVDGLAGGLPVDGLSGLTGALPVDGLTGALPVDGLSGLTDALPTDGLSGLTGALPVDGLAGGLPVDGLSGLTGALPVDGLAGGLPVDGLSGLAGALPVDGLTGALPVDGLSGLTGALPTDGLSGLTGALPVDGLSGLTDALPTDGLSGLADALPTGGLPSPGDLPIVGDLPVSLPPGVPGLGGLPVAGELPLDLAGGLPQLPPLETPLGDVTAVVDGTSGLAGLVADTDVVDSASAGMLSNPDFDGAATFTSHSESVLGSLTADATVAPDFHGSVAGVSPLADFAGDLSGGVNDGLHLWAGSNTPLGHAAVDVDLDSDGLSVAGVSPLGNLGANSHGDFTIQPADTADLLDVNNLGTTGDAVVGTVAHVVTTGSNALADGIDSGSETLGGYLTGTPLATVTTTVDTATSTVSGAVNDGGNMVADHLPNADSLPLDQLPQLPQLPDLPDVNSGDLPAVGDVTSHLPVSLPHVLPDTSAVTDLVSHNPVTDVVHDSPVGGLVDGVTGHLPQVGDHLPVVGDLDLGL